ncbi:uncharacterized protein PHALS_14430 [Plasmopara halstedii]|uniref:Uncharacterized protein n=1 Tax=Plasmopara halstedii TaxID=4781 RepID=A0A0P1ARF3_PLAHL|nr:uncharacterized protein PHALS_14430 [Plasmopara halstedii]CEG44172.1 hypothetical protein PHALS_14430 [Plasmopara halstedii]|eukprot:XP_024580541.1 hypothetical protein PHALS_14430 [Plasmopara halstedii]
MLPSALFDQVIRDAERTLLCGNIERSAFSFMSNWEQSHIEKETRRRLPHSPF